MSIVIIVSLHRKLYHKKKKKAKKETKTEHPRLIIWMSNSFVSIYKDVLTSGVCRVSSQGVGNTPSAVHVRTWLETC